MFCPVVVAAQARPATCDVRPLWVSDKLRSANLGSIGTFQTDGSEGQTIRSFKYNETYSDKNLVVTVGVNYVFDYSPKSEPVPYQIKLAITVSEKEAKNIFESVNSSEASTLYRKKWNLSVSKNINIGELTYIFTVSCRDNYKSAKK